MSRYRLYVGGNRTEHVVEGRLPSKALRALCVAADLTLASQDGRYGKLADGTSVSALTEPWTRQRLDPLERTTRV